MSDLTFNIGSHNNPAPDVGGNSADFIVGKNPSVVTDVGGKDYFSLSPNVGEATVDGNDYFNGRIGDVSLFPDVGERLEYLGHNNAINQLRSLYQGYVPFMLPIREKLNEGSNDKINQLESLQQSNKPFTLPIREMLHDGNLNGTKNKFVGLRSTLYKDVLMGQVIYAPVYMNDMLMPPCVLSVQGKKNIVRTGLVERKGSVKELVNIDDYRIEIKGFIPTKDELYNESILKKMILLYESKESVSIRNVVTDLFFPEGTANTEYRAVIESFNIDSTKNNVLPYAMSLEIDSIAELIVG